MTLEVFAMPDSLGERVRKSKARVERQEHDYRVAQRQEREAQKKTAQRRNYVLGELVKKYCHEDKLLVHELKIRASEAAPAASEAP